MRKATKMILTFGCALAAMSAAAGAQEKMTSEKFHALNPAQRVETFATLSNEEKYEIVKESSDSWCVTAYDLVSPENISDFVVIRENGDDTSFNLDWPVFGGYAPESIKGIGDLSGKIEVSRDGGDGGYTMCLGTNEDGTEYDNSQRSIPKTTGTVNVGVMDLDRYKETVDIAASDKSDEEKIADLEAMKIDEETAMNLLASYEAWFGRYEISGPNNIRDGAKSAGLDVDDTYGFYGEAAPWEVSNLTLKGGAGQMNTVYSWGVLKIADIVVDVHPVDIQ